MKREKQDFKVERKEQMTRSSRNSKILHRRLEVAMNVLFMSLSG